MTTMILSGKRQVVLPADLCRQVSLAPGARVRVELAPNVDVRVLRHTIAEVRSKTDPAPANDSKPASE